MEEEDNNNLVTTKESVPFAIEAFLRKSKITENDIPHYQLFLEKWGLKNEDRLRLLTRDELKEFAKEYKNEHKDFELAPSDAALIAETAKNWKKDFEEIIDNLYKKHPDWKCVIEKPEDPPVDMNLQWMGREEQLKRLQDLALQNIQLYLKQTKTKQLYNLPVIHGGLGVGKSRLAIHSNYAIRDYLKTNNPTFEIGEATDKPTKPFNKIFGYTAHIFVDFSRADQYGTDDAGLSARISLGLRVAAHFLFGVGMDWLVSSLTDDEDKKQFTFENVVAFISKKYAKEKHLLLTLQLDEFGHVPNDKEKSKDALNEMLRVLGAHITSKHNLRVCIWAQLTGTETQKGIQAITKSQLNPTPFLVTPLKYGEDFKIVESKMKGTTYEYLLNNTLFLQALDSLGRVGRYIEIFLMQLKNTEKKTDISDYLTHVLDRSVEDVKKAYDTPAWDKLLGGSRVGVRTMVLWALAKTRVSLKDRLNGITVEDARSTGILMLEPVKDTAEEKYTINLPLILLRTLNKTLNDVPDEYLNPVRNFDDKGFEEAMSALRILRQNALIAIAETKETKETKVTYRDLYPNALGYDKDLDQEIPLGKQRIGKVIASGQSATHGSMHDHPMDAIPVLSYKSPTIDIAKVKSHFIKCFLIVEKDPVLIRNVPKAPSLDALVIHPPSHIEGIQYKSSDNISNGVGPDEESDGVLKLGISKSTAMKKPKTIWGEYQKVTDSKHKKFYKSSPSLKSPKFTFVVVSNKPLKNYEEIKEAVKEGNKKKGLPKGVIVICHQNFEDYAGSLAHRGLFLPLKGKREEGGKRKLEESEGDKGEVEESEKVKSKKKKKNNKSAPKKRTRKAKEEEEGDWEELSNHRKRGKS